jgi:hypothetical protein
MRYFGDAGSLVLGREAAKCANSGRLLQW